MPKVLHIISGLNVGGAEMVLYRLIFHSKTKGSGFGHSVVAMSSEGGMKERFIAADIELTIFEFKQSPVSEFIRMIALIRQHRPDVVQTWMYHADLLGSIAASLAGNRRVIWGIRSTNIKAGAKLTTRLIQKACACLSGWLPILIVCVAEASRRSHITLGYDARRMVVVPNGFDTNHLVAIDGQREALRKQFNIGAETIVIGSVGRFHSDKDHNNLVQAAGLVLKQFPDVRFLLVGRDLESTNKALQSWIDATGFADRFILLGERSDVPACLSAMDIFCLHSRTEGFPNAIGEAMAMGLPCVSTDVGDAAPLIADTGVVVPKEDPTALAAGLKQALEMTPEARSLLGKKAKARVYSEYTMDRCQQRFEDLYRKVIAKELG